MTIFTSCLSVADIKLKENEYWKGCDVKGILFPVGGTANASIHNGSQYGESYRSEKLKLPYYPELLHVWGEYLYAKRNEATSTYPK